MKDEFERKIGTRRDSALWIHIRGDPPYRPSNVTGGLRSCSMKTSNDGEIPHN